MASHRILCVTIEPPHRHISRLGTGEAGARHTRTWTIREVREALHKGERFYTVSPITGVHAHVEADTCDIDECTVMTIRSQQRSGRDGAVEDLPACR